MYPPLLTSCPPSPSMRRWGLHQTLRGLASHLLTFLRIGYSWITRLLLLALYVILIMPGVLQVGYRYFFSKHVQRSIVYGGQPRNRLDLYLPSEINAPKPVFILVTGGAWIAGYRAWGSLLGLQLAERDIIVACLDHRNFPQGTISDMVNDVSQGVSFIVNSIAEYGGDTDRIYLMGQSSGAHISSCVLVEQANKEYRGESILWSVSQIKAYFGLAGVYNLPSLVDHFHKRGLYRSVFLRMMEGEDSLPKFSPEIVIQYSGCKSAASNLPHTVLFHGAVDRSIPSDASKTFVDVLRNAGAQAEVIVYDGKSHTDMLLQDPFRGGKEDLFDFLVAFIHANDKEALQEDAVAPPRRRLVPEFLLKLAHEISSF